jgi:hypothetical protein
MIVPVRPMNAVQGVIPDPLAQAVIAAEHAVKRTRGGDGGVAFPRIDRL